LLYPVDELSNEQSETQNLSEGGDEGYEVSGSNNEIESRNGNKIYETSERNMESPSKNIYENIGSSMKYVIRARFESSEMES
jgi:hypothetical protein